MAFWNKKKKVAVKTPTLRKAPESFFTTDYVPRRNDVEHFLRQNEKLIEVLKPFHNMVEKVSTRVAGTAMDGVNQSSIQSVKAFASFNGSGFLPLPILDYFSNQGFVGWQVCAILGQNWLINKALKMPYLDATRHGFDRVTTDDTTVDPTIFTKLQALDKKFELHKNMVEHGKFARMFGIRHTLFMVDGIDYEAPFNPDGVRPNAYKGMTQIDPYWLAPELSFADASQPWNPHFYEPTWWQINGKRVHRSHFVISRNGNDLADILKPAYFYGGIPTTQLIYERIYAAEKTANEAPQLAMSKRLFTLKTDTSKALADLPAFQAKMNEWMSLLSNYSAKIIGGEEEIEQFETSLASLDETIMTQYQLVAAIAEVPATKLLGTAPKGFNATGEYETDSYHEFLESLQEDELTAIADRHTLLCQRSFNLAPNVDFTVEWKPVDTPTAKELAEINKIKADTDKTYADTGALDGCDVRQRLSKDADSGYNGIPEIVPDGPGDREHEAELAALALEPDKKKTASEAASGDDD